MHSFDAETFYSSFPTTRESLPVAERRTTRQYNLRQFRAIKKRYPNSDIWLSYVLLKTRRGTKEWYLKTPDITKIVGQL